VVVCSTWKIWHPIVVTFVFEFHTSFTKNNAIYNFCQEKRIFVGKPYFAKIAVYEGIYVQNQQNQQNQAEILVSA
jgi:ABC-type uncharacterized transport system permease subunit